MLNFIERCDVRCLLYNEIRKLNNYTGIEELDNSNYRLKVSYINSFIKLYNYDFGANHR